MEDLTYIPNIAKKIELSKGAKGILSLDISNFYQSIYTHLIPAIPLGLDEAERQYTLNCADKTNPEISEKYKKYMNLDFLVRTMNCKQSNGLLPGTLISQFLAEALLWRIDKELIDKKISFARYVDDYEIYIQKDESPELVESEVAAVLGRYSLHLNHEKTKYEAFPYYLVDDLKNLYEENTNKALDSAELMRLFIAFFKLEKSGTKGAIRFLVKSIDKKFATLDSSLYFAYLFDILTNNSRSLTKICELLITQKSSFHFTKQERDQIDNLLVYYIKANNHLEAIWLLYLRRALFKTRISKKIVLLIVKSNNELLKVVLFEEYRLSLSDDIIVKLKQNASWLLVYQMFLHDVVTKKEFEKISGIKHNSAFYAKLKKNRFSFYQGHSSKVYFELPKNHRKN